MYIRMYINLYKCVCVGAMKKFTSVSSFCSELRSIATITATMLYTNTEIKEISRRLYVYKYTETYI